MMHNWFECKVRYEKVMENGSTRKVTEPYVFDALSFTEAEARIIEEITPFISGEFSVTGIKKSNISEIFYSENEIDDKWFKARVEVITLHEKTGQERITSTYMLVQASDITVAITNLKKGMEGSMSDYNIYSITETPIMDVYPYNPS